MKPKDKKQFEKELMNHIIREECENVVLYTGIEKIIHDAALRNPDPEHRLFFVGVTRAKENLYIMQPDIDDYYNYIPGDPIL